MVKLIMGFLIVSLAICVGSVQAESDDEIAQKRAERAVSSAALGEKNALFQGIMQAVKPVGDTRDLAIAMDVPSSQIVSVTIGSSDLNGIGICDTSLGSFFPWLR